MIKVRKYFGLIVIAMAWIVIVNKGNLMIDYPVLKYLFPIVVLTFLLFQIIFVIYFAVQYKKESTKRKAQFVNSNNI